MNIVIDDNRYPNHVKAYVNLKDNTIFEFKLNTMTLN